MAIDVGLLQSTLERLHLGGLFSCLSLRFHFRVPINVRFRVAFPLHPKGLYAQKGSFMGSYKGIIKV